MYSRKTLNGVNADIDPIELPENVWTEAENMVPRPGRMVRAPGYKEVFSISGPIQNATLFGPVYMQYSPQLGAATWVYCGTDNIASINEIGVHAEITPAEMVSTVQADSWTGGNLNGIAVINALENPPFYWFKGLPLALPLPGVRANTRYRIMRTFKYHLVGMGVVDTEDLRDAVHWSDAADPGQIPQTWVPAADNEAGDNIVADEDGDIIDGLALRDSFYIYKQDSVYEMSYVGPPVVMAFSKVFGTTGVLAANCIVRVKGYHVVLGNGDIYRHDGQNLESLVDGRVRETFFSTIDPISYRNSFAVYLEAEEEVWFCVPTLGQTVPNLALVWNTVSNAFGYRVIPEADFAAAGVVPDPTAAGGVEWDDAIGAWNDSTVSWGSSTLSNTQDNILMASESQSKFFLANSGVTADGVDYSASIGRLSMSLDDPYHEKAIRRVWPHINAPAGTVFTLELFNQRDPMGAQEQVTVQDFTPGKDGVPVNVNVRYLGLSIKCAEQVTWDCSGFDLEYQPQGLY